MAENVADGDGLAARWNALYASKEAHELGWYEAVPATLVDVVAASQSPEAAIIDVGAGESSLVEHLLARGYRDITLLDISTRALEDVARRLGSPVETISADVRSFYPVRRWDLWHDRATFHFLTTDQDRRRYLASLDRSLAPGGRVVVAAFGPDGPERCAGRRVERYDEQALIDAFGSGFECLVVRRHRPEPGHGDQRPYVIATLRRPS